MFCFWASLLADVSSLGAINAKGGGFTPDWHEVFHVISFFNTMEMLWKINDCKSLENFPKNVYDGVCFNKIASLCCTNYNSTKTRFHCKLFSECLPKDYIPGFTTEVSPRGFCKIAVYKILEKSLRDIFVIPYPTKLQVSNA